MKRTKLSKRPSGLHKQRNPFVVEMLARGHPVHGKTKKATRKAMKQNLDKLNESDYK